MDRPPLTPAFLAIVAYRCVVAGRATDNIDFQVRWFPGTDPRQVRSLVESEALHCYLNADGEKVCWELAEIFQIEPFSPTESGEEIVGFTASTQELVALAERPPEE